MSFLFLRPTICFRHHHLHHRQHTNTTQNSCRSSAAVSLRLVSLIFLTQLTNNVLVASGRRQRTQNRKHENNESLEMTGVYACVFVCVCVCRIAEILNHHLVMLQPPPPRLNTPVLKSHRKNPNKNVAKSLKSEKTLRNRRMR